MAKERVQKILARAGVCSRRKAEGLIAGARVTVNGQSISLGAKADPHTDTIAVDGRRVHIEEMRYLLFYKPRNVLTSFRSQGGKKTIKEFLTDISERVVPAGRLDYDAEGLLLLTNDGPLIQKLTHPRHEKQKTYHVTVEKPFSPKTIEHLQGRTIQLEDGPVKIHCARQCSEKEAEITIHEGRKHIVKRIFKRQGYKVKRLIRMKMGFLELGDLRPGEIRELTREEVQHLKESL